MKRIHHLCLVLLFGISLALLATPVSAQSIFQRSDFTTQGLGQGASDISFSACIINGSCGIGHIFLLANNIMMWMVGVSGAVALFMYIMGGLWMLFSMGNQSRVERGKDILIGTSIALVYILGSYVIVKFVLGTLQVKKDSGATIQVLQCNKNKPVCDAGQVCVKGQCKSQCETSHQGWSCVPLIKCASYSPQPGTDQCTSAINCDTNGCSDSSTVCCLPGPV